MKKAHYLIGGLFLFVAVFVIGCVTSDYGRVTNANTIAAYEEFIKNNPNDSSVNEARFKLNNLQAEIIKLKTNSSPILINTPIELESLPDKFSQGVEAMIGNDWKLSFQIPKDASLFLYREKCYSCGGNIIAFQGNKVRACITCAEFVKMPHDFIIPVSETEAIISGPKGATIKRNKDKKEIVLIDGDAYIFRGQPVPLPLSFDFSKITTNKITFKCDDPKGRMAVNYEKAFATVLKADRSSCLFEEK